MSVYSIKGKGWRYDFTHKGIRYTATWFKTKAQAQRAEAKQREEVLNPKPQLQTPTGMEFLELVNRRLDYVKAYNSERHYTDHIYLARRWIKKWGKLNCSEITSDMLQSYLIRRSRDTSPYTANKELRYLRSLFNFGMHPNRFWLSKNPTSGISFFPVEKKIKYVPPKEDVLKVISLADPETQDYLWTIVFTMARMSEVNRLTWDDIDLEGRYLVLYTRKKRGGHLTPRKIPLSEQLFNLLHRRYLNRDNKKPWVFWHRYWSQQSRAWVEGPYNDRSGIMKTLCDKANVRYFRYHALRHFGASLLAHSKTPLTSIQALLGHENLQTTILYLHSISGSEETAIDVLEKAINGKSLTQNLTQKKDGPQAPDVTV